MEHVAAWQGLLDLCNQPGFVRDVYVNLDCRIERSNLFEGVCSTLSKAAFPVHRPLASAHVLALDGLISIMAALAKGCAHQGVVAMQPPPHMCTTSGRQQHPIALDFLAGPLSSCLQQEQALYKCPVL